MKRKIRVIILEDHTILTETLTIALSNFEALEVMGFFTTGAEALNYLQNEEIDVAIVDYRLPDTDGISFLVETRSLPHPPQTVFLSMHGDSVIIQEAFRQGATAFLPKTASTEELVNTIICASDGEQYLSPELTAVFERHVKLPDRLDPRVSPALDQKKIDILQHMRQGKTISEMQAILSIPAKEIRGEIDSIVKALGVDTQIQALIKSIQMGII
jgi:DNA-binding NarL/FixJ family response regulator